MSELIPFGKYKGQPVEVWRRISSMPSGSRRSRGFGISLRGSIPLLLISFRSRVRRRSMPSETPEHNALQVLFLDDQFCARFFGVLKQDWQPDLVTALRKNVEAERQSVIKGTHERYNKTLRQECERALERYAGSIEWGIKFWRAFEEESVDVRLSCSICTRSKLPEYQDSYSYTASHVNEGSVWAECWVVSDLRLHEIKVEIKPAVGDEYPAVLRQMRGNRSNVLFTERYIGTRASEKQFVETFKMSGMRVVFRHEVEAAQVPELIGILGS